MREIDLISEAVVDLSRLIAFPRLEIRTDHTREHTKGIAGILYVDDNSIWINPDLKGRALYRVVLHEIGHALGLEHRPSKIMAARRCKGTVDYDQRFPTPMQRKAWSLEIARLVIEHRARKAWGKGKAA